MALDQYVDGVGKVKCSSTEKTPADLRPAAIGPTIRGAYGSDHFRKWWAGDTLRPAPFLPRPSVLPGLHGA